MKTHTPQDHLKGFTLRVVMEAAAEIAACPMCKHNRDDAEAAYCMANGIPPRGEAAR